MDIAFEMTPVSGSIILVAGVGGGGGNAVKHLYQLGNTDVSYVVCNTDEQALGRNPVPEKLLLGTDGLGAGNKPEKGRAYALESTDKIKDMLLLNKTRMVFIAAGMGGGTGTGAAPVVAKIAKDMDILTVGIVSIPFQSEGPKRVEQAIKGIEELSHCVDSLIVINNEHIAQIYGKLGMSQARAKADDIIALAVKSIADIITSYADINVDFADVTTVMKDSGVALMGSAIGGGEDRALSVVKAAIDSPLLHHNSIKSAKNVLINMTSGVDELSFEESKQILDYIQEVSALGNQTDVIWGAGRDESLGDNIKITIIATGFEVKSIPAIREYYRGVLEPNRKADPEQAVGRQVVDIDGAAASDKKPSNEPLDDSGFKVVERGVEPVYEPTYKPTSEPTMARVAEPVRGAEPVAEPTSNKEEQFVVASMGEDTMIEVADATIETPAWKRRGMNLYNEPRDPSVKRETLGATPDLTPVPDTVSLFD